MLFTTSRKPSRNTRVFTRKISELIPESAYIVRGKKSIFDLIEIARNQGFEKICIITDKQGNPHLLRFIKLTKTKWDWAEELKIKGTYISKIKIKANAIQLDKELEKLFNTTSKESEIKAKKQDNEIIFKKGQKTIIKIKLHDKRRN